ncbi:MAG: sugar ABC transporter ATP-binding protein [Brevinema sp.]
MEKPILRMENISKSFGTNKVLKSVCLNIYPGKIMALMGENGAGKSTLMKILAGIERADEGTMIFKDSPYAPKNTVESEKLGVIVIHQELNLFPDLTVMDNVFLGSEIVKRASIDYKAQYTQLVKLLKLVGLDISPYDFIRDLSIGQQQLVEIVKALHKKAKILVMDEPTSALSKDEIEKIFTVIEMLKSQGTSIVYISHRMQEIFRICDHISVLRDGTFIGEYSASDLSEDELIQAMVGRSINDPFPYLKVDPRGDYLTVENLYGDYVKDVNFTLQKGEILGIGGLMGSGRTTLAHMLYGLAPIRNGSVLIKGKKISIKKPSEALAHSIVYVSEDRKGDGLFINFPIAYNTSISSMDILCNSIGHINQKQENSLVHDFCSLTSVKASSLNDNVGTLSGGNQQKVALARALLAGPMVLILDEPTRGIDIGARREIYSMINEFKRKGVAVILISSDMPELLSLSDRVLVMSEGKMKGILSFEEKSPENILKLIVS